MYIFNLADGLGANFRPCLMKTVKEQIQLSRWVSVICVSGRRNIRVNGINPGADLGYCLGPVATDGRTDGQTSRTWIFVLARCHGIRPQLTHWLMYTGRRGAYPIAKLNHRCTTFIGLKRASFEPWAETMSSVHYRCDARKRCRIRCVCTSHLREHCVYTYVCTYVRIL